MNLQFVKRALLGVLVSGITGLAGLPAAAQQASPAPIRVIEKAAERPQKGPAVFDKAIGKACNVQTISCGQTVSGSLSSQDCGLNDGSYVDYYEFPGTTGQTVTATMRSTSVNSYLALLDPNDEDVLENNNGAGGNDARLSFQLDLNGNWAIAAGSFSPQETGPYTLTLTCSGTQTNTPAAPTNLQATAVSSTEIDLSWQDNSNNETGFIVEAIVNGSFQQIGTVNANVTAAQVTNLTPQTAYTFRIRARNANGTSAPSNQVTATTPAGGGGGSDYLTTPAFPDFRFKVRIFNATPPLNGRKESDCIPDTLCVSGAVAGRSEVFVRVVGPRPNGFLWPTIVRFTPSRVEVDVQQISTGITKTYVLLAAPSDSDELNGLQDRTGFQP